MGLKNKSAGFSKMTDNLPPNYLDITEKVKELVKKNNVHIFSSNYALYGDISRRVMKTLKSFSDKIEICFSRKSQVFLLLSNPLRHFSKRTQFS